MNLFSFDIVLIFRGRLLFHIAVYVLVFFFFSVFLNHKFACETEWCGQYLLQFTKVKNEYCTLFEHRLWHYLCLYNLCTCCSRWHNNAHWLRRKCSMIKVEKKRANFYWNSINNHFTISTIINPIKTVHQAQPHEKQNNNNTIAYRNCVWTVAPLPSVGLTSAIFGAKSIGYGFCLIIGLGLLSLIPEARFAPPPASGEFIIRMFYANRVIFWFGFALIKWHNLNLYNALSILTYQVSRIVHPQNNEFHVDKKHLKKSISQITNLSITIQIVDN